MAYQGAILGALKDIEAEKQEKIKKLLKNKNIQVVNDRSNKCDIIRYKRDADGNIANYETNKLVVVCNSIGVTPENNEILMIEEDMDEEAREIALINGGGKLKYFSTGWFGESHDIRFHKKSIPKNDQKESHAQQSINRRYKNARIFSGEKTIVAQVVINITNFELIYIPEQEQVIGAPGGPMFATSDIAPSAPYLDFEGQPAKPRHYHASYPIIFQKSMSDTENIIEVPFINKEAAEKELNQIHLILNLGK